MDADEWLCAYLLRFGTETIDTAEMQEGEAEFLIDMGRALQGKGSAQSAWWTIVQAWHRRNGRVI